MKKKSMLIVAIILMSIGFAAISTTLIINENAKVSENKDDFSVIFTAATLDGLDVYSTVVDDTKKIINFSTSELKTLNQTSSLSYEVTNNSSNYDASVVVACAPKEGTQAKYTSIKNKLENDVTHVLAKNSVNGKLTITLDKTSTESVTEEYTCKLEFTAVERDELAYNGQTEWNYDYTGGEQAFIVPTTGTYKLETWGAQGGSVNSTYTGGYGAYSVGEYYFNKSSKVYINVGGMGKNFEYPSVIDTSQLYTIRATGGYNGGGNGLYYWTNNDGAKRYNTSGGGATHIATT